MNLPSLGTFKLKIPLLAVTVPLTNELSDFNSCTVVCATASFVSRSITLPEIARFGAFAGTTAKMIKISKDRIFFICFFFVICYVLMTQNEIIGLIMLGKNNCIF